MAIIVYITKECQQETQNHGLQDALERLKNQLETDQDTRRLESFPSPYWMKKQFGRRQGRLVIREELVKLGQETHQVFVFLMLIQRGDSFYDNLSYDILKHGESISSNRLRHVDLKAYVEQRLGNHDIVEKQTPSPEEAAYLYAVHNQVDQQAEQMIYESSEWFSLIQQTQIKQIATRIFDTLPKVEDSQLEGGTWLTIDRSDSYKMLVRSFPVAGIWFLAGIAKDTDVSAQEHLQKLYHEVLYAADDKQTTVHLVLQHSRKTYPALISAEETLWKNLEFDAVGNLALSPEESEVLASAKDAATPFPLFINGRAGSGKSTVLQYLFTDYLYYFLKNQHVAKPVYFSCSNELIKRANEVVSSLLLCSGKYWQDDQRQLLVNQNKDMIADVFKEFRRFLYSHVPEQFKEDFLPRNYVDYAYFRQSWEKQFKHDPIARQKYSADVSWHVIRSYIKGTNSEFYLEPLDYQDIEQKQQTVTDETFKLVYDKVWEWYKDLCNQHKLWDDQDLARLVLSENLVEPSFAAIFCDESQDFTRLELEVILRLSLFSNKRIESHEIRHIPFVFAGDQFQTLNPTGFRWEATKAQFVEKFIFALETHNPDQHSVEMNYKELSYNFRSAPPIVRFSNVVQVLRALLFKLNSLCPQIAWGQSTANYSPVMKFSIHDKDVWQSIKKFKDIVFIVPCAENEETDYIQKHPFLKTYIQVNEDGSTSLPVLSASRAKGLEFNRVVVLDFASHIPHKLSDILARYKDQDINMESDLALQYFLNRLYVAVTRAKRQLIILDTDHSLQDFWHYFTDPNNLLPLHYLRQSKEVWQSQLGVIADMPLSAITDADNNEDNALDNAREFARNGRDQKDAYLLRQAGSLYRQVDEHLDSLLCFAEAYQLDKQFSQAAKYFIQANSFDEAFLCYWRGQKATWADLLNVASKKTALEARLEFRFASLYRNTKASEQEIAKLFTVLSKNIKQVILEEDEDLKAWQYVCEHLLNRLVKAKISQSWHDVSKGLSHICQQQPLFKSIILLRHRAEIAFLAKEYQLARQLWEESKENKPNNYYIAVAETEPFPANIAALQKLKRFSTIIEQFENYAHKEQLQAQDWSVIGNTLCKEEAFDKLINIMPKLRHNLELIKEIRRSAEKKKKPLLVMRCRAAEIVDWIQTEQWDELLKYWRDKVDEKQKTFIIPVIVRSLARSDGYLKLSDAKLEGDELKKREQLQEIVRQQYLGSKDDKTPLFKVPEELMFEVGAAFERARRFVDILNYYEAMIQRFPQHETELAKRWIVCKERQVKYYENIAKRSEDPNEREKSKQIAEDNNNRATRARHKLDLSVTDDLGDLPLLSTLQELMIECLTEAEKTLVLAPAITTSPKKIEQELALAPEIQVQTIPAISEVEAVVQQPEVEVLAVTQAESDNLEQPTEETGITNKTFSIQTRAPKTEHKVKENIKLELGEYGIHIIRKNQRINITDEEKGETFSIKSAGEELTGDWIIEHQEDFILLKGTPLWLHITQHEQQKIIKIGHSILGIILDIAV